MKIVRSLNNFRLAGFSIAYGISGALIGGTLNRIMIADLGLPATLVAFFFAIPLLVSPVRVWLGYRSDGFPIFGRRREPYIVLGALIIGLGIVAAANVTAVTSQVTAALVLSGILSFLLYGIGRNLAHNTYQALITDRYEKQQRTRAVTFYEVATLLGAVMGAGFIGRALETYEPGKLISTAMGVAVAVFVLAFFAAIKQEPKNPVIANATERARQIPFQKVLKDVVFTDKQVRILFTLVILTFIGTLAQDALLEPYGGLVLGMSVGDTTRLTMFWGVGVLISMLLSGLFLIKWLGFMRLMRSGIILSIAVFIGLVIVGMMGNAGAFRSLVFVMGLGTGLAGAGMLSSVISFATPIRAGMLLGVFGVANMVGHAFGNLMGGTIVDLMRYATGSALIAYSTLFGMEAVVLAIALYLTTKLDMNASQASKEEHDVVSVAAVAD
ncbi:MAG: BCD family MFS transporter [Anaerolineales bacterium]|nr:BCD family MFS transporter [Anaerolineales bacterium]